MDTDTDISNFVTTSLNVSMAPRTSQLQFDKMIGYMEKYGDLNTPKSGLVSVASKLEYLTHWETLTDLLNIETSGIAKPTCKWKKVWSDLKNNTKKKLNRLYQASGGRPNLHKLSDLEIRILKVIGSPLISNRDKPDEYSSPMQEIAIDIKEESRSPGSTSPSELSPDITHQPISLQPPAILQKYQETISSRQLKQEPVSYPLELTAVPTSSPLSSAVPALPRAYAVPLLPLEQPEYNSEDMANTVVVRILGEAEDWNRPGASYQINVLPPSTRPDTSGHTTHPGTFQKRPRRQKYKASEKIHRSERKWRNFQMEKQKQEIENERERLRLRALEIELSRETQRRWQGIAESVVQVFCKVIDSMKYEH